MSRLKTSLGIDISDDRINLVLLKGDENGIELLKSASAPVPDGAIRDGNIEDTVILAKAIKKLRTRNKIPECQAAVSLLARPVLMQIMYMPKPVPANISQFLQDEVRQYAILPGKNILLDFCGIGSAGQAGSSRLFVVAADGLKVAEFARACNRARLNVAAIEPSLLACVRAFYAEKIAKKNNCNVLMAILETDLLTLCVFRNQKLDFVRTKSIGKEKHTGDEDCHCLAEELNAVIQFYDIEVPDSDGKWEITAIANGSVRLPANAEEYLRAKFVNSNLEVKTCENVYQDIPVGHDSGCDKPSPVAIGLAMGLLGTKAGNLRINLLPPQAGRFKTVMRDTLVTANLAAAVLFLMILAVGILSLTIKKVDKNVAHQKQIQLSCNTNVLLEKERILNSQISTLTARLERMKGILNSQRDVDWSSLLKEIRSLTPRSVCITSLLSPERSVMILEGLAVSYDAVNLFIEMLNKSEHIGSASLIETEKDNNASGLVRYAINCSSASKKGK